MRHKKQQAELRDKKKKKRHRKKKNAAYDSEEDDIPVEHVVSTVVDVPEVSLHNHYVIIIYVVSRYDIM